MNVYLVYRYDQRQNCIMLEAETAEQAMHKRLSLMPQSLDPFAGHTVIVENIHCHKVAFVVKAKLKEIEYELSAVPVPEDI